MRSDLAESLANASVQRLFELFVDGLSHLFKFGFIVSVERVEAVLYDSAQLVEMRSLRIAQLIEPIIYRFAALAGLPRVVNPEILEVTLQSVAKSTDAAEDFGAERGAGGCSVGAELGEFCSEMLVEALGASVQARELRREIGGEQLCEARVFRRRRNSVAADYQHNQGHEREELEDEERWNHFDFPSLGG